MCDSDVRFGHATRTCDSDIRLGHATRTCDTRTGRGGADLMLEAEEGGARRQEVPRVPARVRDERCGAMKDTRHLLPTNSRRQQAPRVPARRTSPAARACLAAAGAPAARPYQPRHARVGLQPTGGRGRAGARRARQCEHRWSWGWGGVGRGGVGWGGVGGVEGGSRVAVELYTVGVEQRPDTHTHAHTHTQHTHTAAAAAATRQSWTHASSPSHPLRVQHPRPTGRRPDRLGRGPGRPVTPTYARDR